MNYFVGNRMDKLELLMSPEFYPYQWKEEKIWANNVIQTHKELIVQLAYIW